MTDTNIRLPSSDDTQLLFKKWILLSPINLGESHTTQSNEEATG